MNDAKLMRKFRFTENRKKIVCNQVAIEKVFGKFQKMLGISLTENQRYFQANRQLFERMKNDWRKIKNDFRKMKTEWRKIKNNCRKETNSFTIRNN